MISMEDPKNMRDLIEQAIKIDNRLYQSDRARKGLEKALALYKTQTTHQQAQKLWYGAEPMDLSTTRESQRKPWKAQN
jgi:hypothetical protein